MIKCVLKSTKKYVSYSAHSLSEQFSQYTIYLWFHFFVFLFFFVCFVCFVCFVSIFIPWKKEIHVSHSCIISNLSFLFLSFISMHHWSVLNQTYIVGIGHTEIHQLMKNTHSGTNYETGCFFWLYYIIHQSSSRSVNTYKFE